MKMLFLPNFPGPDTRLELSPVKMAGLPTTSPRIVHLSPPIQFIAIPDTSGWISPIFPFPSTPSQPRYILGEYSHAPFLLFSNRSLFAKHVCWRCVWQRIVVWRKWQQLSLPTWSSGLTSFFFDTCLDHSCRQQPHKHCHGPLVIILRKCFTFVFVFKVTFCSSIS